MSWLEVWLVAPESRNCFFNRRMNLVTDPEGTREHACTTAARVARQADRHFPKDATHVELWEIHEGGHGKFQSPDRLLAVARRGAKKLYDLEAL